MTIQKEYTMSRYLVKDKYTYEKRRQIDYTYHADNWIISQNHISGRYIYEAAEHICTQTLTSGAKPAEIHLSPEQGQKFASVSGLMVNQDTGEGMLCRVTLWGADGESFCSVVYMTETPRLIATTPMDFVPVRMTLETKPYDTVWAKECVDVTITYGYVLDTLGQVGGQAHFYTISGGTLQDAGTDMVLTLDEKTTLTSPTFPNHTGTPYNMLMPRRNTIFMVLSNHSTATHVQVSILTSTHPYSTHENYIFKLDTYDQKPHPYYLNLSYVPALCDGRLLGFKLTFLTDPYVSAEKTTGKVIIHRYSFEQEAPITETPCEWIFAVAEKENKTVTVGGLLDDSDVCSIWKYIGGKIRIYITTMANDQNTPAGKRLVGETDVPDLSKIMRNEADEREGRYFEVSQILLYDECTSLLPYQFLAFAEIEGEEPLCLADRFYIENYRDFQDNPYAFELPPNNVSILDFGAYGDAYHDDTQAIQAAIDHVAALGGGRVTLPGTYGYGRRYLATSILMRSNVELHLEKGAILWQSQIRNHYDYEVTYGHDGVIPGINWTHCLHVCNLPLIQGANIHHVKITGEGKIRMMDTGSEEGVGMPGYASGCPDRIHIIPIGFYRVKHCECSDFDIVRSNNYHTEFSHSSYVYIGNVKLHEVKCVSGDGFGVAGAQHVMVNRCFMQSNDDGIVMSTHYFDPRGILWWTNSMGEDNSCRDITTVHSYINSGGGKALAFITWGTNDPIQELEEISDILAYDNILTSVNPVGTWPDNPYNGKQPFDNTETDDYSPVKNVRIFKNRYQGNCTLGPIACTNVITDCGVHSTNNFRNGDFTLGGLANWTIFENANPNCADTVIYADKEKGRIHHFEDGHVAAVQGLYLAMGHHVFEAELMTGAGGVQMYVADTLTGEIMVEKNVICQRPTIVSLAFDIDDREAKDVYIGFASATQSSGDFAIFDACTIHSQIDEDAILRRKEEMFMTKVNEDFDIPHTAYPLHENGKIYLAIPSQESETIVMSQNTLTLGEVSAAIRLLDCNRSRQNDKYGIRFGISQDGKTYGELCLHQPTQILRLVKVVDGKETELYVRPNFFFTSNDFHLFRLDITANSVCIWIDGSMYASIPYSPMTGKAAFFVNDASIALHEYTAK